MKGTTLKQGAGARGQGAGGRGQALRHAHCMRGAAAAADRGVAMGQGRMRCASARMKRSEARQALAQQTNSAIKGPAAHLAEDILQPVDHGDEAVTQHLCTHGPWFRHPNPCLDHAL